MGFDPARLVQVWCPSSGTTGVDTNGAGDPAAIAPAGTIGSGYRVSAELVLTAAHVVDWLPVEAVNSAEPLSGDAGLAEVTALGSAAWVPAAVVWRDDDADLVLLRVGAGLPDLPPGSPPPRWGRVDGDDPLTCTAVGFPWAAARPDAIRDTEQLFGFIPPLTGQVSGAQAITVLSSAPRDRPGGGSPWTGISGAAVFVGRYLVGVVVTDPQRYRTDRLHSTPLAPLLDTRPALAELLGANGGTEVVRPPSRLALTPSESIGLRSPYRPLRIPNPTRAPAMLLLPEHGVVPLVGRSDELTELERWCCEPGHLALRVVTGDGGAGKTRLAAQACLRLAAAGWDTGFANPSQPGGEVSLDFARQTLVVVDDADLHVDLIAKLLTLLDQRPLTAPPVRLLLLARHTALWWDELNRRTETELAEAYAGPALPLTAGELTPRLRAEHYDAAHAAFRNLRTMHGDAGSPPSSSREEDDALLTAVPDLSDPTFKNPLLVHMTALLDALTEGHTPSGRHFVTEARSTAAASHPEDIVREKTLRGVLRREQNRWERTAGWPGEPTASDAVTLMTLYAPRTEAETVALLTAAPALTDVSASIRERGTIARWLHRLYFGPTDEYTVALRPDLLAEQLLASNGHLAELTHALITRELDTNNTAALSRLISELVRASRRDPVRDVLDGLLKEHLAALLDAALDNPTGSLPSLLDLALHRTPQPALCAELTARLPERSTALAALALTVTQQGVDYHRGRPRDQDDRLAVKGDLARLLNDQSNRLADLGRREDALSASDEAVTLHRDLAAARRDAPTPDLAMSLNNQSNRLAALGRHEEALSTIEEAVTRYRDLMAGPTDAATQDLAMSLNNQCNRRAALGRPEAALSAIDEAITLYRHLATAQPDAFNPDLAASLTNQTAALTRLNRWEEALSAIDQAVTLRRGLAAARPDAFNPDLATSLTNQAAALAGLDRWEEALSAIDEAVTLRRGLAAARPDTFSPDLAATLINRSTVLANLGRSEEALSTIDEAETLRRNLAVARPDVFTPDLAATLISRSTVLANLGRSEEALSAIDEAVTLYRDLAATRPEAFSPDLARALNNQATALADLGRLEEALSAIQGAVTLRRDLTVTRPEAFTPDLASTLNNESLALAALGRRDEALSTIEEAVSLNRHLAAARPDAFTPDLASTLNNQSVALAALGRRDEALSTIEEAVTLNRHLVAARPDAFAPALARSLLIHGVLLTETGQPEAAVAVDREAVALYLDLHRVDPDGYAALAQQAIQNLVMALRDLGHSDEAIRQKLAMMLGEDQD